METCKSITDLVCKNCIFGKPVIEEWNDKPIEYVTCHYDMDTKNKKLDDFCGKHGEWIVVGDKGETRAEWRGDAIFFILNRSTNDK
jgi:hypothetical protein